MAAQAKTDLVTVTVGGKLFYGWKRCRISRGLHRCASDFDISVSERWAGQDVPWQIQPFSQCLVSLDDDIVLTGYIDRYEPSFDPQSHGVRIVGRSKTADLVDCEPDFGTSDFQGYRLDQLTKALVAPFGIAVKIQTDVGAPFPTAALEKNETAFNFLNRLSIQRGVVICDDETGSLVLTSAGQSRASSALIQGASSKVDANIIAASGSLSVDKRFSKYTVRAQAGMGFTMDDAMPEVIGVAYDPSCPRYRPYAEMAETALDLAGAQLRARWRALYNAATGIQAQVTVAGWRQADGSLWRINQRVSVGCPFLQLDREMLVAGVEFNLDEGGHKTELTLGPIEAYTPDPASIKVRNSDANAKIWDGAKGIG